MNWNNEQHQEYATQREYVGYTGTPSQQPSQRYEQPSQMYEQSAQQQTFQQPEQQSTHTYGQMPYGYPSPSSSAQPVESVRIGGALSYTLGWFSGILFLLFAGENRFIRFHALQSIAFFGAITLLDMAVPISWVGARAFHSPLLFLVSFLFFLLVNVIAFVGWLVAMIQAGRGVYYKLPFVGEAIARRVHWNPTLK